ncbi:hypothetical protein COLO4_12257 [Corchorus olitorius]|uniref:F-box domain-containing protein n=1 Tax=Corchorus olitorius TaxID=93759 RepID=A0A1R3K1J3_9ROSI|nr:hypothetical protein COLO4_12257 [Corchorus olitorius]
MEMEELLGCDALPSSLVLEILSNLPVKALLRFKCVCKSWKDLINSEKFINWHLDYSRRRNKLGILMKRYYRYPIRRRRARKKTKITSFSIISNNRFFSSGIDDVNHVFDKLDGIITSRSQRLAHCDGIFFASDSEDNNALLNLATRETIILPKSKKSHGSSGFGIDLKSHKYKALRIGAPYQCNGVNYPSSVQVYTMGAYCWRHVNHLESNVMEICFSATEHAGFYFNGAIHWPGQNRKDDCFINSFDLGDEKFRKIAGQT